MTTKDPSIDDVRVLESFIAGTGDSSMLLTFQGILRSHERMFQELSTPPADDVREAVMNALACHRRKVTVPAFNRPVCSCGWASTNVDYGSYAFDGHIADAVAAEVRPRGTVTDAEVKWEYVPGEIWTDRFGSTHVAVQNGVIAPDYVSDYIAEGGEVLRRKVGPWETVTREARS